MHENREISWTPWSKDEGRSAKAINRTADMNVQEKSDCAVVPVNQPNKEGLLSAEVGEGRAQTEENIVQSYMCPTQSGANACPRDCAVCGEQLDSLCRHASTVRAVCVKRARTDLCGGRRVIGVPTATTGRAGFKSDVTF